MHGLNQGLLQLQDLCKCYDIIAPFDLYKLQDFCPDMLCHASSAMESVISRGLLRGRPFGGISVHVKSDLVGATKLIKKEERFIILMVNDLVVINVYLPCASNGNWQETYMNCLASITEELTRIEYKYIVFGGDLNMDFCRDHPLSDYVNTFCEELNLQFVDDKLPQTSRYSYRVEASNASSLIDHFAVSKQLFTKVSMVDIIDSGINFSDHCPIVCHVTVPLLDATTVNNNLSLQVTRCSLRWKKQICLIIMMYLVNF